MKKYLFRQMIMLICVLAHGCVTSYEVSNLKGFANILVVDGMITDSVTAITLSRSVGLADKITDRVYIDHATIYVECDDGTVSGVSQFVGRGVYKIATGDLNPRQKYRLKVLLDGEEYRSEFLQPLVTPDFEVSWTKKYNGEQIGFQVSTHDPADQSRYYLWTYREDWEFTARMMVDSFCYDHQWAPHDIRAPGNHYYCWKKDSSRTLLLGNTERMVRNEISNREILSISASSERFSLLYRIAVKQCLIRKEAYTYYANVQKNAENTGSIFAPIPAEIQGNLYCATAPNLRVIGYVEVSVARERKRYVKAEDAYIGAADYEDCVILPDPPPYNMLPPPDCFNTAQWQWVHVYAGLYNPFWSDWSRKWFYNTACVDCLAAGGTKNKPSFWPNDHQ